ncbi:Asp23/Gls24 family envelope stress response protein [Nonomuraea sp. NEAU-A123]|uniref:Asp23/Gls24 family envelope stress response protein n=1 Tax=Nonomuraea sp. NEAU-A123 TaxID=2839649 RepID=UPI001BE49461|nr:Asp23/Gls24 family envelope stress response protein [Nonomuraea sp. NEAU-A123]MBT2229725.1 Asp23/Gls24 family envelope stress response protein [Nonomuraea sp. NEAU-A123]
MKGRIKVADEVVEKVTFLAVMEVPGVADLGGDLARAFESVRDRIGIGSRRGTQGINAQIQDRQVAVSLTIVVEYGHVVMEVATAVKTNVARSVSRMLGLRVTEVNVTVDDVRLPGEPKPTTDPPDPDPF